MSNTNSEFQLGPNEIGIHEKLSFGKSLFYGVQSVIALNLFLGIIIIASIMQLDIVDTAILITLGFLSMGIATFLQAGFFMKYPVVQCTSFTILAAFATIGLQYNLATAFGSLILGAVILILLGVFKLFSYVMKVIPPIVASVVIIVIGINVMYTAATNLVSTAKAAPHVATYFLLAAIVFCLIFAFKALGNTRLKIASFCARAGVLMSIVITTVIAALMGQTDFSSVATAPWFALPPIGHYGFPQFQLQPSLVFVVLYIIVMVETVGNWFAISHTAKVPITKKEIDRGIIGEGLGCLIGAFIGTQPVTSYATNCGVISITKVYSRWSAIGAAVIIIVLSFIPKVMYVIASLPGIVMWGVLLALCTSIIMSGLQSVNRYKINERNVLVIGIPIALTLLISMFTTDILGMMPMFWGYLFSSSICIGTIAAIILNLVLPKQKGAGDGSEDEEQHDAIDEPIPEDAV
ncbi:MAG: purine/pyrimidine permease [Clostridiales bacterium]|nr:purine/pyrimidine permease [Clostridiales bacterium]